MSKKKFELREPDFIEVPSCPLCGSNDKYALRTQKNISIYREIYPLYSLVVPESFSNRELLRCRVCGQVYWSRIPKFEALPSYQEEILDYGFDESRALLKKAHFLNEFLIEKGDLGALVDIGACRGELLSAIRTMNSSAVLMGIEPSFGICNEKDNIQVIQALFNSEVPLEHNSVDVFSAFDCFEHLPRLDETFNAIGLFLREGGLVYFETPDGDYRFNNTINNNNMNLFWIEHLSFLTRKSVAYICNKYGYEIAWMENAGHVDSSRFSKYKSMIKTWVYYTLFRNDNPMYINSSDHLRVLLKKI